MSRRLLVPLVVFAGFGLSACKPEAVADPRLADRVVEVTSVQLAEGGSLRLPAWSQRVCRAI